MQNTAMVRNNTFLLYRLRQSATGRNILAVISILMITISSCTTTRKATNNNTAINGIRFLDEYTIPDGYIYNHTTVGGLSGIDYNPAANRYFIISDDRSAIAPARFYTAQIGINNNKIDTVIFTGVTTMKQVNGHEFPAIKEDPAHAPDPESIRYNPKKNTLIWSSEGDKAMRNNTFIVQQPFVYEMDLQGRFKDSFSLYPNMHLQKDSTGPRVNGVFEGTGFDDGYKHLYVSIEEPVNEDGPRADVHYAGAPIRITKFDAETKKPLAQYGYLLDAVSTEAKPADAFKVNGVPEILWAGNNHLLVLERSFSTGTQQCTIKIFLADLSKATNVADLHSLYQNKDYKPVTKKLLLNMNDLGRYIDNVEGITFGPTLPNGHRSLVLIADNNFQAIEQSQVFLFEVL